MQYGIHMSEKAICFASVLSYREVQSWGYDDAVSNGFQFQASPLWRRRSILRSPSSWTPETSIYPVNSVCTVLHPLGLLSISMLIARTGRSPGSPFRCGAHSSGQLVKNIDSLHGSKLASNSYYIVDPGL